MPAEGEKNRVTFLKRKANALFSRLQRLQTSLSNETLSGYDEPTLTVRLEQIDELQSAFNVLHTELEELDFDEIGSEMSESFDEFVAPRLKPGLASRRKQVLTPRPFLEDDIF